MEKILVVGLSPAWQRTLEFSGFTVGEVNRVTKLTEHASGKPVNVARVARELGATVQLLTVAGGHQGKLLTEALRAQRLPSKLVRVTAPTRICQTLLAETKTTELVEEAHPLEPNEVAAFIRAFKADVLRAKILVLTGSAPKGCGDFFYKRLLQESRAGEITALIDAQGKLLTEAIPAGPFLVRINRKELSDAVDATKPVKTFRDVIARSEILIRRGAKWVVVSNGAEAVIATSNGGSWKLTPPSVMTVNPIGCGDAMLGGIAFGLSAKKSVVDSLVIGVACGCANATTHLAGIVNNKTVTSLRDKVRIEKIA